MNIHRLSAYVLAKLGYAGSITNATQDGTAIDTFGFRRLCFVCHLKTGAATTLQIGLAESDTSGGTYSTVNFIGTSTAVLQPKTAQSASTEDVYLLDVDLQGARKRWIRPEIIGTGTAGDVEVVALLYQALESPSTQNQVAVSV